MGYDDLLLVKSLLALLGSDESEISSKATTHRRRIKLRSNLLVCHRSPI